MLSESAFLHHLIFPRNQASTNLTVAKSVEITVEMASRKDPVTRRLSPGVYKRPDGNMQSRIVIPPDLRWAYGRTQRVISLGTRDPIEANKRHARKLAEHESAFETVRRGTASRAFEAFARKLHKAQTAEIQRVADEQLTTRNAAPNVYTEPGQGRRLDSADPDLLVATVGWAADWFFADTMDLGVLDLPDELRCSLLYRQVLRECAEVLKDSWRAGREAEVGRPVSPPRYPALAATPDESVDGNRAHHEKATRLLSRYYQEVYLPAQEDDLARNTAKVKVQSVELFNDLVADPPLYLLTRAQLNDFQQSLKLLPDGRVIDASLGSRSKRDLVALQRSGATNLKRLAAGTIQKHISNIKTILAFALDAGHLRINPALGMKNVKATAANPSVARRPFSRTELEAIFSLPIYAGCRSDTGQGLFRSGDLLIRDERFWVPMLLFLTGARASEVAGLERSEVTIADDHIRLVFRHTRLRRLKNDESERVIPLHPWAAKMGFDDYVRSLPSTSAALFPKLVAGSVDGTTGKLDDARLNGSSAFRQFNRTVLNHVGLKDDPAVSLHSFRHVFEDAMTGQDIPNEVMFRLTGRSIGSSRAIYARSLPADEGRRAERARDYLRHVERIGFGGLDLSHLHAPPKPA